MTSEDFQEFVAQNGVSMASVIDYFITCQAFLTPGDQARLLEAIGGGRVEDDGTFDLLAEVEAQLKLARLIRSTVLSKDDENRIVGTVRDAKDALSACTTLLSILHKLYEEIYNQNRMRAIEQATEKALKDVSEDVHQAFLENLQKALEGVP